MEFKDKDMNRNLHNSTDTQFGGNAVAVVVCADERGTVAANAAAGDTMSSEGWGA